MGRIVNVIIPLFFNVMLIKAMGKTLDLKTYVNRALKFFSIFLITVLVICGLIFIAINYRMLTNGSQHTPQSYIKYDLKELDSAIKEFKADLDRYPQQIEQLVYDTQQNMWMGPYIKANQLKDPWGQFYGYQYFPKRSGYQLYTLGADQEVGGIDFAKDLLSDGSIKIILNPSH